MNINEYLLLYPIGIISIDYIDPYASVCIHMHPSRIRMHPYAPIRVHYASERQYSTHIFAEKGRSQQNVEITKL